MEAGKLSLRLALTELLDHLNRFGFCLGTPRCRQRNAISAASRNSAKRVNDNLGPEDA
jgi:hypothetical protein